MLAGGYRILPEQEYSHEKLDGPITALLDKFHQTELGKAVHDQQYDVLSVATQVVNGINYKIHLRLHPSEIHLEGIVYFNPRMNPPYQARLQTGVI